MKPDSTRSSKSELKVYEAGLYTSSVRLECDDSISAVLYVFDGKQNVVLRIGGTTLTCLAHVLVARQEELDQLARKESRKDSER